MERKRLRKVFIVRAEGLPHATSWKNECFSGIISIQVQSQSIFFFFAIKRSEQSPCSIWSEYQSRATPAPLFPSTGVPSGPYTRAAQAVRGQLVLGGGKYSCSFEETEGREGGNHLKSIFPAGAFKLGADLKINLKYFNNGCIKCYKL